MVQPHDPRNMGHPRSQPKLVKRESQFVASLKCFVSKHWIGLLILAVICWWVFLGGWDVTKRAVSGVMNVGDSVIGSVENIINPMAATGGPDVPASIAQYLL